MTNKKMDIAETENELSNDWENIKDKAYQTTEAINKATGHAKNRAKELLDDSWQDLRSKSTDFEKNTIDYVVNNPGKSLVFATLAGFLLANILRK